LPTTTAFGRFWNETLAEEIGFTRSFSILDRDDQKSLLAGVIAACEIDTRQRRFPKPDVLATIFSLVVNTGGDLDEVIEARYPYLAEWADQIGQVRGGYEARKRDTNSMDFDDLLVRTRDLLRDNRELRALYQKRFRHLLVDEYQDTNSVQCEMIDLLAAGDSDLMVVGDDAQSIYSWRGADMENILCFPERHDGVRVYKIETNYRSVPEILELSNAAIRPNRARFEKNLRAVRAGGVVKPALVPLENPACQAAFVAQRIIELRDGGMPLEEMAVLYRAHYQSLEIQMELTTRGIPFRITSGLRFFEQAHIKDVAAFLRFVTNRRDEVSFKRMVQLLPGLGNAGGDKLWRDWLASGWARREEVPPKFSEVLCGFKAPKKAAGHWEQLAWTLDELAPDGGFCRPSEMIFSVLEGVYDEVMRATFDNYDNRRGDIEQLISYGEQFDDIMEFLAQLSLMSSVDGEPAGKRAEPEGEMVTLSSIHQAKGLEWRAVFLIWLSDGMFPIGRVLEAEDDEMLEEERRLFYVAITRAKDELYLSYPMVNPKSYSGDIIQRPSRFLDACPADLLEEWRVEGGWDGDTPF